MACHFERFAVTLWYFDDAERKRALSDEAEAAGTATGQSAAAKQAEELRLRNEIAKAGVPLESAQRRV